MGLSIWQTPSWPGQGGGSIQAEIVREKKPIAGTCLYRIADVEILYFASVYPFSTDGMTVDQTIACEHLSLSLTEIGQVLPVRPKR